MQPQEESYKEVLRLIRPTHDEILRVEKSAGMVVDLLTVALKDLHGFGQVKVLGSAKSGYFLRGTRDIDLVVTSNPYSKAEFRKRVCSIDALLNIQFSSSTRIVTDKFNCTFNSMNVSCGVVDPTSDPLYTIQGDILKHGDFWSTHTPPSFDQVLLIKQFFKNAGVYGACVGGFAAELMAAHFGSFYNMLEAFAGGLRIVVNFSTKSTAIEGDFIVAYPYSGLDNLIRGLKRENIEALRHYARDVLNNPAGFIVATRRTVTKAFWQRRSEKYGSSESFGFPDLYLARREDRVLSRFIFQEEPQRVLDAGCGNGTSTLRINKPSGCIVIGIDGEQTALKHATKLARARTNISFQHADLTKLPFGSGHFDVVYAKRAISNLPCRDEQAQSLLECMRVLKHGGVFLLQDLFLSGYDTMNRFRRKLHLPDIEMPYHTLLFAHEWIHSVLEPESEKLRCIDYTSTYYLVTRGLLPAFARLRRQTVGNATLCHNIASVLPSPFFLGLNCLYVCRKA